MILLNLRKQYEKETGSSATHPADDGIRSFYTAGFVLWLAKRAKLVELLLAENERLTVKMEMAKINETEKQLASLRSESEQAKKSYEEEVDEFNQGFDAFKMGKSVDDEPSGLHHDQWQVGYAWASFDSLRSENEELKKDRDAWKVNWDKKQEIIERLCRNVDVLTASLAEADEAIVNAYFRFVTDGVLCTHCGGQATVFAENIVHKPTCIVLKSQSRQSLRSAEAGKRGGK